MIEANDRTWWQDCIVYQAYVRSFADSNGDGIGDLAGLRQRLDHLVSLGVDAIWLNPCYPSPQRDHGYDVANYFDINPEYGTLETFDELLARAADRGIRIMMDLVPNHCSDEHAWFRAAVAAGPGSIERDHFYFRDGRGEDGGLPPNNWQAAFGGSAWTRVNDDADDGQWYLGTFTPHQPDFDHTHPDVRQLFRDAMEFWFDRGVEGFRVDAVAPVGKDRDLPDQAPVGDDVGILDVTWLNEHTVFRPEGHDVWRLWRTHIDDYERRHPGRDLMMVGEAYAVDRPEIIREFVGPDQFHQMFTFDLMLSPWAKVSIESALREPFDLLGSTGVAPAWALNNHDIARIVSRLGHPGAQLPELWKPADFKVSAEPVDLAIGERRARAIVALVFALPGSVYLYQGEELGLPEVLDIPDDRRTDPIFELTDGAERGRDGCRVPLPWTTDASTSFGFSSPASDGTIAEPWLPQPADWGERSLAAAEDRDAPTLRLYRDLADVRREHAVPQPFAAEIIDVGEHLVGVRRGDLVVVVNPTSAPVAIDIDHPELAITRPIFASEPSEMHTPGIIPADSTVWFTC